MHDHKVKAHHTKNRRKRAHRGGRPSGGKYKPSNMTYAPPHDPKKPADQFSGVIPSQMSRDELRKLAKDLDIVGRGRMTRDELADACEKALTFR